MIDEKKLIEDIKQKVSPERFGEKCNALDVIYAVLQVIDEQPKTDWIPCEERLPELTEGSEVFKQSKCCLVTLEWWDGENTEEVGWYNQSGVWNYDSENCKVIAWQPIQPYKKEGAE